MSGHQKIITLQLICTNNNCFYKIVVAKLLALNVLSIALYYFQKFQQCLHIAKLSALSCIDNKSTQITFKQEPHSNII